jgi:tetratricopeptide (TPR) repeat protein
MGLLNFFGKGRKDDLEKRDVKVVTFDGNGSGKSVDYSKPEAGNVIDAYTAAKKGVSYEKSEQWLLAIEQHKKSIALAPKNDPSLSTYHTNLGVCYANVGKIDESIRELEIALQIDPNDERSARNLKNVKNYYPLPEIDNILINKEYVREIFLLIKNPDENLIWVSWWRKLEGFENIAQEYKLNKSALSVKHEWLQRDNLFLGTTSRIICVRKKRVTILVYSINYDRIFEASYLPSWGAYNIKLKSCDIPHDLIIESGDDNFEKKIIDQILSECTLLPDQIGNIRPDIIT